MGSHISFQLLGPVSAVADGHAVALGAPKQRALLVALLLAEGAAVPRHQLVASVWGDDPPASAAQSLQVYVHNLRRVLGTRRIATQGTGYQLLLDPDELDVARFDRLVGRARTAFESDRPADAADESRRALALWRGAALADITEEPIGAAEAPLLEDRRVAAQELLVDAELALGRDLELLASLERLIAEEPYRERFRAQQILALYRAGRQKDALEAYGEARAAFVEELGVEPGPALQELQRAILRQDPALDAPARGAAAEARLPRPPTALLGRRLEIAAVSALLRRDDVRLVTLTGMGGSGKTRLAIAVADELAAEFRDGAAFVELAPVRDPAFVAPTIADALGLATGEGSTSGAVVEWLRDRSFLLVLDNLEQLPDSSFVAELLAGAPRLRVVATSRASLRLSGEHEYPVAPLPVADAVTLFEARARAADPAFVLDEQNAEAVAAICARVDGLPLAIELAAARAKLLSPAEIATRIGRALDLLTGGARDLPLRQQTLRATFDWSYELLGDAERTLLARLAVFANAFDLAAAESVGGDDHTIDLLGSLVDRSLVRRTADGRFTMLATIHEYALERLAETGGEQDARERHALHFLSVAEDAAPGLIEGTAALKPVLERLDASHDDLRAAIGWAGESGASDLEARLTIALRQFWIVRGELHEGRRFFASAIEHVRAAGSELLALTLVHGGTFSLRTGRYDEARQIWEEALELHRAAGNADEVARCLAELGSVAIGDGDLDGARELYLEAATLFRDGGKTSRLAQTLANLGAIASMQREFHRSVEYVEEAIVFQRAAGEQDTLAVSCHNRGRAQLALGQVEEARESLAESRAIAESIGYREVIANCLAGESDLALVDGDPERSARLLGASQSAFAAIGITIQGDEAESQQATLASLLAQLGAARVEQLLAEGRSTVRAS
jgi:predicted ATPase/DNA-binding SARP family transcriptional activator